MKRILICLLFIIFSTKLFANEPDYSFDSLNKNKYEFGWKVSNLEIIRIGDAPAEIYTLTKSSYILKCFIIYRVNSIRTFCELP